MICLAGLMLYLITLAPTVLWGDDAKFQRMAYFLELKGDEWGHPLWVTLAHLFTYLPVGDVAYRANLVSAVAAAATLYFVYRIIFDLSGSHLAAVVAASALGVSHTFWLHAVRTEVYTLNTLFLVGLAYLAIRWDGKPAGLCLFAFLYGSSIVNHLMMAFALPGYLAILAPKLLEKRLPIRAYITAGVAFLLGVAPYLALVILQGNTERLGGIGLGALSYIIRPTTPARDLVLLIGFLGYQFVGVSLPLGLVGLWISVRNYRTIAIGLLLLYFERCGLRL